MSYKEIYAQAKKENKITDLTPKFVKFEKKGDMIIGRFKGSAAVRSGLGDSEYNHYIFDTDDGLVKCHVGAATDKEISAQMEVGNIYCLTFVESIKISGGRSVNKFKVEYIDMPYLGEEPPLPDEPHDTK